MYGTHTAESCQLGNIVPCTLFYQYRGGKIHGISGFVWLFNINLEYATPIKDLERARLKS